MVDNVLHLNTEHQTLTFSQPVNPSISLFHGTDHVITIKPTGEVILGPGWKDNTSDAARAFVNEVVRIFPELIGKHTQQIEEIERALSDPHAVHVSMLRGTIARPGIREMLHIHGAEALKRWDSYETIKAENEKLRAAYEALVKRMVDLATFSPPATLVVDQNAVDINTDLPYK